MDVRQSGAEYYCSEGQPCWIGQGWRFSGKFFILFIFFTFLPTWSHASDHTQGTAFNYLETRTDIQSLQVLLRQNRI